MLTDQRHNFVLVILVGLLIVLVLMAGPVTAQRENPQHQTMLTHLEELDIGLTTPSVQLDPLWVEDFQAPISSTIYYTLATPGSGLVDADSFLLTQDAESQNGRIFYRTFAPTDEFTATFSLYLGNKDGSDGAAFLFCPTYDYPSSGGYWLDASCPNGYLVAFDTYEFGAPSRVYVAFQNTDNRLISADLATPLDDNNWHAARVSFDGTITVTLDGNDVIAGAMLPSYVPFAGYFGFSAATGLGTNEQRVDSIRVYARTDGVSPTAAFTPTQITAQVGDAVAFTNVSTGTPILSYTWDLGDGSPLNHDVNPTHIYHTIGGFTVVLTATNLYGQSIATGTVYITTSTQLHPFWVEDFQAPLSSTIYYTLATPGSGLVDASSFLLTQDAEFQNGRIFYRIPALMSEFVATFNLYLGDHDGSDGAAFVFCPTYDYPSSNGSWLDASCPNGYLVAFDTYEFGAPSRVYVAFQNTNNRLASVDLATPLDNGNWHTVAVNLHETITVTLDGHNVITGAAFPSYVPFGGYFGFSAGTGLGTNEQRVDDIHVYARTDGVSPTAAFTSTYIIVLTGDTVTLTNLTTGTPFLSYIWNFGDGSPLDYDINPSHTYNTIGDFIVALTATNPFGESVVTGTVSSGALAVAAFTPTVSIIHVRETATFTNLSTGFPLPTYTWDWGDGSPLSSAVSPTHPYNTIGNFTVTLTATNRYNQNVATGVVTVIPYKIYLPMVIRD